MGAEKLKHPPVGAAGRKDRPRPKPYDPALEDALDSSLDRRLWSLQQREGALDAWLQNEAPPWQRQQVRLALCRQLGAERARELWRDQVGVEPPGWPDAPGAAVQAAATALTSRVYRPLSGALLGEAIRTSRPAARTGAPALIQRDAETHHALEGETARSVLEGLRRDGGEPLPEPLRARMKELLGHDFSQVRIHTDDAASAAARQLQAHAFAVGHHVFFGRGKFDPTTVEGERLLIHELVHVMQSAQGRVSGKAGVSSPGDALEREAAAKSTSAAADRSRRGEGGESRARVAQALRDGDTSRVTLEDCRAAADPEKLRLIAKMVAGDRSQPREKVAVLWSSLGDRLLATARSHSDLWRASARFVSEQPSAFAILDRASSGAATRLLAEASRGTPLPSNEVDRLAPHVGREAADAARLHVGPDAAVIAAGHEARAVTVGDDVFFAPGELQPGSERGDHLLTHELAHVAQGRRGEPVGAAAKGLTSGGILNRIEAEADLRADVAAVELHYPKHPAPHSSAPAHQPQSQAERQVELEAQQKKLASARTPIASENPVARPPALSPEAPRHQPPPKMAPPPAPPASGNAYVDTLQAPPSKQALELWDQAGSKATGEAAAEQAKIDASMPKMPVALEGAHEAPPAGATSGAPSAQHQPGPAPHATPTAKPKPTAAPPPTGAKKAVAQALSPSVVANKDRFKIEGQKALDELPTTNPKVDTDPGPAPVAQLAGHADPERAAADQAKALADGAQALDQQKRAILAGKSAAQVQPAKVEESLKVPNATPPGEMPKLPPVDGMVKLKGWDKLPAAVHQSFDELARPKMAASLAQSKDKMQAAATERDSARTQAVEGAQAKVKQANEEANAKQQAKVAEARVQIGNQQAQTLAKQQAAVKDLETKAGAKRTEALGKIDARVQSDQQKVEGDFKKAGDKAKEEQKKREEEAAKKKAEAEKKKKNESWWHRAADAVGDEIKDIADDVEHVLDAIAEVVGKILDAVKSAATAVIDAARDFICSALSAFGDWLKSEVDAVLGSVFPELAAELDHYIDAAVHAATAAVNAIADGLKKAVTELCDQLKGAIDAIVAVYKAAVQAAAAFAQAVATGDWKAIGKMVLEAALKLLGIDPAAFYALVGKAEDSFDKIVADPGAFVGHLVDAVKLGFKQFGANFWTHLKDGIVQWLFGTFADAGITMPARFDLAGVFDLVAQVLGLTWTRLRAKAVKLVGEKNVARLELVAKYVQELITGGMAGLWEKIKEDLSGLWDMVIGGAKEWLIETLVKQAIIKIATMWNPAGAIVQLLETAWNVYCWVKENAQRIFGLVQAVVDSISEIANGAIGKAADWIEASLAKLIPIAISLFADLLGLGGIADKMKEIINKVQTTIDQAIDKLLERVLKMFKGKGGAGEHEEKPEHEEKTPEAAAHGAAQQPAAQAAPAHGATPAVGVVPGHEPEKKPAAPVHMLKWTDVAPKYAALDHGPFTALLASLGVSANLELAENRKALLESKKRELAELAKTMPGKTAEQVHAAWHKQATHHEQVHHAAATAMWHEYLNLTSELRAKAPRLDAEGVVHARAAFWKAVGYSKYLFQVPELNPPGCTPEEHISGFLPGKPLEGTEWNPLMENEWVMSVYEKFSPAEDKDKDKDKEKDKDKDKEDKDKAKAGDHAVGETIKFEAAGHGHTMWFAVKGEQATLMVASNPLPVSAHLDHMQEQVGKLPPKEQNSARGLLAQAQSTAAKATAEANRATRQADSKDTVQGENADREEHAVAEQMKQLFVLFEGQNASDLQGACKEDPAMALVKYEQVMAERQAGAVPLRPAFLAGANVRLKGPEKPLQAMQKEVSESGEKYILKGDPIPMEEIAGQGGISRVLDLPSVFNYYLPEKFMLKHKISTVDDFLQVCADGKFNPQTDLDNTKEIRGKVGESWWFAKARASGVTLGQIKNDLTVKDTTYDKGMVRLDITPAEMSAAKISLHKPTAFDGLMQGWGTDPMWVAAPGQKWGLTRDGMQEGVVKAAKLGAFQKRSLILPARPAPVATAEDAAAPNVQVPKALVEPKVAQVTKPSSALAQDAAKLKGGEVLYQARAADPKTATQKLLSEHSNAKLDHASGVLTLPPVSESALAVAPTVQAAAEIGARETGTNEVSADVRKDGKVELVGKINPTAKIAEIDIEGLGDQASLQRRMSEITAVNDPKKLEESKKNDESFQQRRIENSNLHADPVRVSKDLEAAGLSKERYDLAMVGGRGGGERMPLAFEHTEQFGQFKAELADLVGSTKVDGQPITATAKIIGTSVNFYSGNPKKPIGHHYDRLGPKTGDVDIELTSPELTRVMLKDSNAEANEKVVVGGKKVIFKNERKGPEGQIISGGFHSSFPAFKTLCEKWSKILGREVDIKLRIDLTAPSRIQRPTDGPVEILRKEH